MAKIPKQVPRYLLRMTTLTHALTVHTYTVTRDWIIIMVIIASSNDHDNVATNKRICSEPHHITPNFILACIEYPTQYIPRYKTVEGRGKCPRFAYF